MRKWTSDQTFVLICKKCGRKLDDGKGRDPARALGKTLKRACKSIVGKKNLKVVMTSCLKLCPKGQISVAVLGHNKRPQLLTVKPDEVDETLAVVREHLDLKP